MLTIYSKNNCPLCDRAKRFLESKKIEYQDINIEDDPEARAFVQAQGHRSVPQIYYMGKLFVSGELSKMSRQQILDEIELRSTLINQSI
jgi:glutaredoxin